jgi:hypothetical protein
VIEKQLENRMRAAVDGEPPLGFDPREVVRRAARLHRQRRATIAAAGGAGAVLVVATSIAFATAAGGPRPSAGATGDASSTMTGSATGRPVCQSPDEGEPGADFPGSDKIVSRLEQEVPAAVHEHLGVGTKPVNSIGAYDCPPTVVARYSTHTVIPWLTIAMVHARTTFDDGHDPSALDTKQRLVRERPGEDGARIRIYQIAPDVNEPGAPRPLSAVRLGADGMVTAVAESNGSRFSEQQLVALASDARLRFPLSR